MIEDFGLAAPWFRHHEARLVNRIEADWDGVRLELVTREADGPCVGASCLPDHLVTFLIEGRRLGLINAIDDAAPRRVGQEAGWTRFVPAQRLVRTRWDGGRFTYLMVFVAPSLLTELGLRNGIQIGQTLRARIDVRDERFARVLGDMARELAAPGLMHETLRKALASEFCIHLLRLMQAEDEREIVRRGGLPPRPLALVLDAIEQGVADELTVAGLADIAGLSVSHFTLAFRQSTGLSPHRYITERRLDLVRRLMDDASLSLTDIALRAGFSSSSHLATAFRRATGLTPREWRRR